MAVYYINFLLILGLAFPLCLYKPSKVKNIIYLVVTFGYMWFLATFRFGIGFDYNAYIQIFQNIQNSGNLAAALSQSSHEIGFTILTWLMGLFVHSPVVMYGIYTALIFIPVIFFIYRHCKDVWLSTWLYVTLVFFYANMSFIRQSLACSIIVLGYGFLQVDSALPYWKKLIKASPFLLFVLLAATFHKTALISIPIFFLMYLPLNAITGSIYGGLTIIGLITSKAIIGFVTRFVFTEYAGTRYVELGLNQIFILIPAIIFASCLALSWMWKKRDSNATMLLNLALFSLIIWIFGTRHGIIERFSMYNYVFMILAWPAALRALKSPDILYQECSALSAEIESKKKAKQPYKTMVAHYNILKQNISDHQKYYWCAIGAVIVVTFLYNYYGMYVENFYGVFPYGSVLEWLNSPPM